MSKSLFELKLRPRPVFPKQTGSEALPSAYLLAGTLLLGTLTLGGLSGKALAQQDAPLPSLPPAESSPEPVDQERDPDAADPAEGDLGPDSPDSIEIAPAIEQVPTVDLLPSLQDGFILTPERLQGVIEASPVEADFDSYRLGPGDSLFVSVQRFPDLSFQATLDLQGNVVVPIQGAVSLEGLTLSQAEQLIRNIYNQYVVIRQPQDVTLTLVAQRGVEVTILGEVERPGFYPLADPRVATALLTAGGPPAVLTCARSRCSDRCSGKGGLSRKRSICSRHWLRAGRYLTYAWKMAMSSLFPNSIRVILKTTIDF
ncbi:polysaccharide biosynthesis/export family protein [Vasconcelosia minhoensis]|uniref:polysaccharide biosynthesis/export family protein n=1 Tax=Vasconcelosia minhoensis TaxID=3366354 RepID=UPI001D148400|nr:polysaccharide biosynthesis/export family protein [Romeria gracilis]